MATHGKLEILLSAATCIYDFDKVSWFAGEIIQLLFIALIPSTILIVCSIMIVKKLIQAQRQRKQHLSVTRQSRSETAASLRAIIFSVVFLLLATPNTLVGIIKSFSVLKSHRLHIIDKDDELHYQRYLGYVQILMEVVARCALEANYALNLWLYLLTGKQFRKNFCSMLLRCCK